jgi:hypothetical protein
MISFVCKQCGKTQSRPDEAAGTLVFCECGQANRVPWEGTAAAEEEAPPRARRRNDEGEPRRSRRERRRTRAGYCLDHEDVPATGTCADCGEGFCPRCIVTLQGATLCGPCKDQRVRTMQRPPQVAPMAILGMVLGLVIGPFLFFAIIVPVASDVSAPARLFWALLAAALSGGVLAISLLALRQIDTGPNRGGRALAMTGLVCALAGILWSLSHLILMATRAVQE